MMKRVRMCVEKWRILEKSKCSSSVGIEFVLAGNGQTYE